VVIGEAEIDTIVGLADAPERNRRITATYARLTAAFAELVDAENLPWTAFGAVTSAQVGTIIRLERSRRPPMRWVARAWPGYTTRAKAGAAAFARGNRDVFDHLGRAFARFLQARADGDPAAEAACVAALDAEPHQAGRGRAVTLREAFETYRDLPADPTARARSVAWANLALAVVEQSRVQHELEEGLTSFAWRPRSRRLERLARRALVLVLTESMEVPIGRRRIRPGRRLALDLPAPLRDLAGLDPRFASVADLVPEGAVETRRWTDLVDRLRFISGLMRLLQRDDGLRAAVAAEA